MFRKITLLCLLAFSWALSGFGQSMTLQQVVDRAIAQSLTVEQGVLQLRQSEVNLRQNEMARYPNISARTSGGYQFGLNIDPTTNNLVQQRIGFLSGSLDAGVNLYQGGLIRRSIAQNRAQIAAGEANVMAIQQDVALQAAQTYLQILLAREEIATVEAGLVQAQQNLARTERLIQAGTLAPVEVYDVQSTVARQQQRLTVAQNSANLSTLQLRQLLRLEPNATLELQNAESLNVDGVEVAELTGQNLYDTALPKQPAIRAAQLNIEAAELGIEVAKAGYLPTIGAFGQLNTRYSTSARDAQFGDPTLVEQELFIDGVPVTVGTPQASVTFVEKPFTDQISDFFGQSVGLSLTVPIFSNGRNKAAVQRSELAVSQAKLQLQQEKLALETDVQQALQAAQGARADVQASTRALEAAQAAYDAAERRQALGAGSSFDLSNAQILLQQAQVALLRARYQFIFNAKVVDFYLGRPL